VFQNGAVVAQVDAGTLGTTITTLDPSTLYTFQVQAVDGAGNMSVDGPSASVRLDLTPPVWPRGSALGASASGTSAVLVWTAAVDDVAVTGYRVFEDGQPIQEVAGSTLSVEVAGLSPNVAHLFQVQAVDGAGNVSADGPTRTVRLRHHFPDLARFRASRRDAPGSHGRRAQLAYGHR
jgi:chitodextrinase